MKALRGQRGKLVDVVLVVLVGRHAQIDCPPALVVRSEVVVDVPGEKHRRGIDREEAGGAVKLDHTTHLLLGAVQERVKVQPAVSEPNHLLVCALRHVPLHEGHTSRVVLELDGGATLPVAFRRDEGGAIEVDLAGHPPTAVKRMVVDWPSRRLAQMTLIDTPGISSITAEASARTVEFLAHDDDDPGEADAVIYLLRHVHADDVRFLEAFHDRELAQPTPVNALGVLSRADEIGVCRLDALESASRIAARLSADPRIRRLCQTVVPVAGLLAQAAAMLTEDHVAVLRAVRSTPDDVRDHLMLTPDRFVAQRDDVPVVPAHRMQVLSDLGWFGVRLGVQALLDDPAMTASRLSPLLREASGIERLRAVLIEQLAARADVLKARSAALIMDQVLARDPIADRQADLAARLEAVLASAHDYAELRLLSLLRAGVVRLPAEDVADAERLLGVTGQSVRARVGLPDDAGAAEVLAAGRRQIARWRRRAEHPLSDRAVKDAAAVLVRTCEGIVVDGAPSSDRPAGAHDD